MTISLKWIEANGEERLLDVDALVREGYSASSEVTKNPVERGVTVTDNIRDSDDVLTIEFVITNTPIVVPRSHFESSGSVRPSDKASVLQFDSEFDRVRAVEADLRRIKSAALMWHITTDLREYTDFAISQIQTTKDDHTGDSCRFILTLDRVRYVSTSIAAVPHRMRRTRPQVSRGTQPVQPRESVLHQWLN